MKNRLLFLLVLTTSAAFGQLPYQKAATVNTMALIKLLTMPDSVRNNVILNEQLVSMVQVSMADTLVPTRTQTHQTRVFNWALRTLAGLRWRSIEFKKYKLVGQARNGIGAGGKEHFTEYDVTFNLFAHLPEYQNVVLLGYKEQATQLKGRNHQLKKYKFDVDTLKATDMVNWRVHPEVTPNRKFRDSLEKYVYPVTQKSNTGNHPNFNNPQPVVGVYGPFVLDCNHSCGPEIHPYEWVWWLDVNYSQRNPGKIRWVACLFKEGSNRFERWTKGPRVGYIAFPFAFKAGNGDKQIQVNPLVLGSTNPTALAKHSYLQDTTQKAYRFATTPQTYVGGIGELSAIKLVSNKNVDSGATYWIDNVKVKNGYQMGYIHLALSTDDVFAVEVIIE